MVETRGGDVTTFVLDKRSVKVGRSSGFVVNPQASPIRTLLAFGTAIECGMFRGQGLYDQLADHYQSDF